jgi:hypothetical protein
MNLWFFMAVALWGSFFRFGLVVGLRIASGVSAEFDDQFWLTASLTNSLGGTLPVIVAVMVVVPADGVFGAATRPTVMPSAAAPEEWKVWRSVDQV